MERFKVTGQAIRFGVGEVLQLDKPDKADAGCLQDLGEGRYRVTARLELKRGAEFGYSGPHAAIHQPLVEKITAKAKKPLASVAAD